MSEQAATAPEPTPSGEVAPLRVGVVGAGPWAALVHAPMVANHPETELVGVWARRPEATAKLAARHGTVACGSFAELVERCDALTFAVPPDVQVVLATRAANAGKALLLDKPIALEVAAAEGLADAVDAAGVGTQIVLTWRYTDAFRSFLAEVHAAEPIGARGAFLNAGALGGPFATPWRLERGPLFDLGPHVIDALDAALGPVTSVRAHGDERTWVGLLLEHEGGLVSEVSLTSKAGIEPSRAGVEVFTTSGSIEVDTVGGVGFEAFGTVMDEFVRTARGEPHPLDVRHGLRLQRILAEALVDLRARS